jgi:hypothetical protein
MCRVAGGVNNVGVKCSMMRDRSILHVSVTSGESGGSELLVDVVVVDVPKSAGGKAEVSAEFIPTFVVAVFGVSNGHARSSSSETKFEVVTRV